MSNEALCFYPTCYPTLDNARKPDTVTPYHIELYRVGAAGLEPAASCSRSRRATGLRYAPLYKYHNNLTLLGRLAKRQDVQESVQSGRSVLHYPLLPLSCPPLKTTRNIVASSACW